MTHVTVDQLAQEFGCTARHIGNFTKEGMPKAGHGKYDLEVCKTWYIHYLKAKLARRVIDEDDGEGLSNDRESARYKRAQADKIEYELAELRGLLIPLQSVRDVTGKIISEARQQLLQLPGRIAPQLEGETGVHIKIKLTDAVHAALKGLSQGPDEPAPIADNA